eukprot:m.101690 g.101690  ORF g.101690 m.101690 type:complete len:1098 (+) comp13753_c0_seq1:463-3756(+)
MSATDDELAVLCQQVQEALKRTLSPNKEELRRGEAELREYEQRPFYSLALLNLASKNTVGLQQAAAICLKNFLSVACQTGYISEDERKLLRGNVVMALLSVGNILVTRQLIACLYPLLDTETSTAEMINVIHENIKQGWSQGNKTQVKAATRCYKVVLRAMQMRCWESLTPLLLEIFTIVVQLTKVAVESREFELGKLLSHSILIFLSDSVLRAALSIAWQSNLESAQAFCQAIVSVISSAIPETEQDQIWVWKMKNRLVQAWSQLYTDLSTLGVTQAGVVPGMPSSNDQIQGGPSLLLFNLLKEADLNLLMTEISMLNCELPGLDDMRDSPVFIAFEGCAAAALDSVASASLLVQRFRKATLLPHAEAVLTSVYFRFLATNGADDFSFTEDPEEYANMNHEELRRALSCCHGLLAQDLCDECPELYGQPTARAAALNATRALLLTCDIAVVEGFYHFLHVQLNKSSEGLEESKALEVIAFKSAALRALAAMSERFMGYDENIQLSSPDEMRLAELLFGLVRNTVIPMMTTQDSNPFTGHVRCVACMVVEHFIAVFAKRQLVNDVNKMIQGVMSSLCDPQIGVRAHALNSLDEMVKSRSDLRDCLSLLATEAMNWLASLVDSDAENTAHVMMALMSFLFQFECRLGAIPISDSPQVEELEMYTSSIVHAHVSLLEKLCDRFVSLSAAHKRLIQEGMRANDDLIQDIGRCIEVIHAVLHSSPKDERTGDIRPELVPPLVPYTEALLDPVLLMVVCSNGKEAEATDVISMLPSSLSDLWGAAMERIFLCLDAAPRCSEVLIPMICEYLHQDGSRYLLSGGIQRVYEVSTQCMNIGSISTRCRVSDLLRSALLMFTSHITEDGIMFVLSFWQATQTGISAPEQLTQVCVPIVQLIMTWLQRVVELYKNDPSEKHKELLARLVCALSAGFIVDPRGCMGFLQGQESLFDFFVQIWEHHYTVLDSKRSLDLRMSVLGLSACLEVFVEQHQSSEHWPAVLQRVGPLLRAGIVLVAKLETIEQLRLQVAEQEEDGEEDYIAYEPDDIDEEFFPDIQEFILDDAKRVYGSIVLRLVEADSAALTQNLQSVHMQLLCTAYGLPIPN